MKIKNILLLFVLFSILPLEVFAEASTIDFLRSTGKIYSVIAVFVIILLGIGYFLIRMDRKLTKLEKQLKDE